MATHDDQSYIVAMTSGVLRLSFNRPDFGNAINADMVPSLIELFEHARRDPGVRAIHVRGEGRIFSAGGDVAGFAPTLDLDGPARQEQFRVRIGRLGRLVQAVVAFDRPIVVAVRGAVAGAGLLFPLAADYVLGDPTALFVFAHQGIGLSPDGGVSALLPQVVGHRAARGLVVTAARVKAEEALRLGLLNRLVEGELLEDEAGKLAAQLARAPQTAVRLAKRLVNESPGRSLSEQLDAEVAAVAECVSEDDFAEGVRAFIEKRKAEFPSACDDRG